MRRYILPIVAVMLSVGCVRTEIPQSSLPEDPERLVPEETLEPSPGETVTITAGFPSSGDTRTRIAQEGSVVKVLWTAGDTFYAVYGTEDGSYYRLPFTTNDDGVTEADFSCSYVLNGTEYDCFYPGFSKRGRYQGEPVYGINLPAEQTAVPGGIAERLNVAYSHHEGSLTSPLAEALKFYNLQALVKFRLSGTVASRVKEVRFTGSSSTLAGDLVLRRSGDVLAEYPGLSFSSDIHSSKVVLKGDFEAGVDYYIAAWPQQLSWFRMEFCDENGNSTLKHSSKALTLVRSRVKDFGTIDLGDEFEDLNDGSMDPVKYMSATEGSKPVTIAVIPEGFTKDQLGDYERLAKSGIDALFDTEPYRTYANRFNVYILKVASRESGASVTDGNGNVTTAVDTYFGVRWGTDSYGDMRADANTVYGFVSEKCPDIVSGIHTIDEVPVLMIINDTRYGGICNISSSGRAHGMVPYVNGGGGLTWGMPGFVATTDDPLPTPVTQEALDTCSRDRTQADVEEVGGFNHGDWRNIVVHEFGGHGFARLGDEYWNVLGYDSSPVTGHTWPVPYCLNVASDPAAAPWKEELLERLDDLIGRDSRYGRIGVYQGAGGSSLFGRWRSEKISCMMDNRYYFSAWQRYLITRRIFTLSGDLDSFSFENWLAKDVTADPMRDTAYNATPGEGSKHGTYMPVGPLPPPILED